MIVGFFGLALSRVCGKCGSVAAISLLLVAIGKGQVNRIVCFPLQFLRFLLLLSSFQRFRSSNAYIFLENQRYVIVSRAQAMHIRCRSYVLLAHPSICLHLPGIEIALCTLQHLNWKSDSSRDNKWNWVWFWWLLRDSRYSERMNQKDNKQRKKNKHFEVLPANN